jgi:single-strand DNA-binding protein
VASDLNVVVLNGRLTKDPETRDIGEQKVTRMRLAFTSRAKGEDVSNFIDLDMWGNEGVLQYLHKGKQISIVGSLRFREWQSQSGERRSNHEVVVRDLQLMGGDPKSEPREASKPGVDEEIPF